jgi:hypothetical protein
VAEAHAGHGLEQRRGQVRSGADALRAIGNAAWIGLGLLDQLLDTRHTQLRADNQHIGRARENRDRLEFRRIVVELLVKRLIDRKGGWRRGQEHVAVRLSAREGLGAHVAGRSGPVLDNDRLLPYAGQRVGDDARQGVGRAAGGIWNDDLHGPGWISLSSAAFATCKRSEPGHKHCE